MMIEKVGHSELGLVERNDTEVREVWDEFTSEIVQIKKQCEIYSYRQSDTEENKYTAVHLGGQGRISWTMFTSH